MRQRAFECSEAAIARLQWAVSPSLCLSRTTNFYYDTDRNSHSNSNCNCNTTTATNTTASSRSSGSTSNSTSTSTSASTSTSNSAMKLLNYQTTKLSTRLLS